MIKGKGPTANALKAINISARSELRVSAVTFRGTVEVYSTVLQEFLLFFPPRGQRWSSNIHQVEQDLQSHHRCGYSELLAAYWGTGHMTLIVGSNLVRSKRLGGRFKKRPKPVGTDAGTGG